MGNAEVTAGSWTFSSTFTPGAITVDGIAIKLASRAASVSGTFSVCIGQGGSPVAGTTVTVNASDLPYCTATDAEGGWIFFEFSAPVLLLTATTYTVGAQESVAAADIFLFRDATAGNWSRQLCTTTTQAPAVGDKFITGGEHTGAGTGNNFTVTMNETTATDYGNGSTTLASLAVCKRGTLTWGVAASTAYILRLSGLLIVYSGGTLNTGTVASPVPVTSSHLLEFDCAAALDFGLIIKNGGTWIGQGNALSFDRTRLAADAAASATALTVDNSTGWVNGDIIIIAPTRRTYSEAEQRIVSSVVGTTVNITVGLTYPHTGTAPVKAEIIHLTRNVKISAVNASYDSYVWFGATATVDLDWVWFNELGGTGGTANKYGVDFLTTTGSANLQRCSFLNVYYCPYTSGTAFSNMTFAYNVVGYSRVNISQATTGTWTVDNVWMIHNISNVDNCVNLGDVGGVFTNNIVAGVGVYTAEYGVIQLSESGGVIGTFSNNVVHSCAGGGGFNFGQSTGAVSNPTTYFNTYGISAGRSVSRNLTISNLTLFGNTIANIVCAPGGGFVNCTFDTLVANGYTSYTTTYGVRNLGLISGCKFINSAIGVPSGSYLDHVTAEVYSTTYIDATFYNCTWGSVARTSLSGNASALGSLVRFQKDTGTEGLDYAIGLYGQLIHNASEGITASDCLELQPTGNAAYLDLSNYLDRGMFQAPAQDLVARTVYIQLKDNVAWNGTNVSIALYQNNVLVAAWADKISTITTTYTEYSLLYTPTEDGVLDLAIKLDGDAGRIYADGFRWT